MAVNRTSLSAGAVIRAVLLENEEVTKRTSKIYPVVTDQAELPYILYRRSALEVNPQKSGQPGSDSVQMEVLCFTARYSDSVELAEAVRGALDFVTATYEGQTLRSCYLVESEESFESDAYIQQLVFNIKI